MQPDVVAYTLPNKIFHTEAKPLPGETVYGMLVQKVQGQVYLLLTTEGAIHTVYFNGCQSAGENLPNRPAFIKDPSWVQAECEDLMQNPGVQRALRLVLRGLTKAEAANKGHLESYDIPLKLCTGFSSELSYQLVRYLDSAPNKRNQLENALQVLKDGKGGQGSRKQYEIVMACYLGNAPQAWVAKAWGVKRQSVNELYWKGVSFVQNWVNLEGA